MSHCIALPNGRRVSIAAYCAAFRQLRTLDPKTECTGWTWYPVKASDVLHDMRKGIDARINRHVPGFGAGRKWSNKWFNDAWRTARDVNHPRLIVRWVPADLRSRLAHRITTNE